MNNTIIIYSSPLMSNDGSSSHKLAKRFIKEYKANFPENKIEIINLNDPDISNEIMSSANFGDFFGNGISDMYINKLKGARHLIVVSPMINFNIPAVLKNFIDHIAVAGKTFKYKYNGNGESEGLLKNLDVQIIATQGAPKGWYEFGDHVKYLEGTFNFLGMNVRPSLLMDGTKTKEFNDISIEDNLKNYDELIKTLAKFK